MADGVPVVGHVKGVIHYACGDKEGGHRAMKSASRTTGVMACGAGGFLMGGPAGAVAGGVYGGALMDSTTTLIDSKIHGEHRPAGYFAAIENAIKNPNSGDLFDLAFMPVADGLTGYSAGKLVDQVQRVNATPQNVPNKVDLKAAEALKAQAETMYEQVEAKLQANPNMPSGEYVADMREVQNVMNKAHRMEGQAPNHPKMFKQNVKSPDVIPKAGVIQAAHVETTQNVAAKSMTRSKYRNGNVNTDDDDTDDECICRNVIIPVLYINIRSVNPNNRRATFKAKIARLSNLIATHKPYIVAIVETWLTDRHSDDLIIEMLGLNGYEIFCQNRNDADFPGNAYDKYNNDELMRRGGGILLAWKRSTLLQAFLVKRSGSEDYKDNIVNFDLSYTFNCDKCCGNQRKHTFGITVVYRRPQKFKDQEQADFDEIDALVKVRLTHIPRWYNDDSRYNGWAMFGDFNYKENSQLDDLLYLASPHDVRFPLSSRGTHQHGAALDQVFGSSGFVVNPWNGIPLVHVTDLVSDHAALIFNFMHYEETLPGYVTSQSRKSSPMLANIARSILFVYQSK